MRRIFDILLIVFVSLFLSGCDKDDFMDKFPPEILYKQLVKNEEGKIDWVVSPNAKTVELSPDEDSWVIRARISAPNELKKIVLKLVEGNGSEKILLELTDLVTTPNVYNLEYNLIDIQHDTEASIEAVDKRNLFTKRNFLIIKK